jgi:GntP family gluconate:H+ symporter
MTIPLFLSDPIFILLVGILIVIGGIIGLKLHPFLALLLAAFVVAWMTPGSAIEQYALTKGSSPAAALLMAKKSIGERVALEFGTPQGKIGILIAMAAIIGKCMLESGAAEKIIRSLLLLTGVKKAPVAFLVSSFFIRYTCILRYRSFFLMMPLAKAMSIRIGKNYLLLVLSIMAGSRNGKLAGAAGSRSFIFSRSHADTDRFNDGCGYYFRHYDECIGLCICALGKQKNDRYL